MLYERWRQISREFSRDMALREMPAGREWTFQELARETERDDDATRGPAFPQGLRADFVLAVLRAWRDGRVVCPLEAGQPPPTPIGHSPDIVHLKTTSATTGASRVVAFSAAQLMADADNIVRTMGLRRDWPNLGVISLAHSYGFSNLITPLLLHGIPLILLDSPLPEAIRHAAASVNDLTLPAVPALWRAWHEAGAIPRHVRVAISAGAPLPLRLEQEVFDRAGLKLHNFLGATECGGIAYDGTDVPRADATCVGGPMENVQLVIAEDGCLEVRGPAVGEQYLPEPDPSLLGGCYRTSDLAEISGGQVFLRGRVSDQINIAGRKISPESIERVLLTHPQVRECLVFGVPSADDSRSEGIFACVVAPEKVTEDTLKQFLLARLPAWKVPRDWRFLESLSVNQRGKLSRSEWREIVRCMNP